MPGQTQLAGTKARVVTCRFWYKQRVRRGYACVGSLASKMRLLSTPPYPRSRASLIHPVPALSTPCQADPTPCQPDPPCVNLIRPLASLVSTPCQLLWAMECNVRCSERLGALCGTDIAHGVHCGTEIAHGRGGVDGYPLPAEGWPRGAPSVSYTHLTLPTICSV
eukprot:580889-Rhodomonas_salina.1